MAKKIYGYNATKIEVNLKANDPVDIRCGGPYYLGFDFYVASEDAEKYRTLIKETCKEKGFPIEGGIHMTNGHVCRKKDLWTKAKIIKEIKEYSLS